MKAVIHTQYGPPELLEIREIDKPRPLDDQMQVRVRASSINDWDLGILEGSPFFMRFSYGWFKPKLRTPGCDIAGIVEVVGKNIKRFAPGDTVFGDLHACGFGGLAEYVCVPENAVEPMPGNLSFEQAAAIPHAATLAWQSLFEAARITTGQQLLINGAGGGVGTIAFQIAKINGLEVTGVDREEKFPMLQELGFDALLDYKKTDFTKAGKRYDLILDVKMNRSPFAYLTALKSDGCYVTVGGSMARIFQAFILGGWIAKTKKKNVRVLGLKANRGLAEMGQLFESGRIVPIIDGPYKIQDVPAAMRRFLAGEQKGRIVIAMH